NAAQTGVAMALRAQLAGETDPERLKQYEVLWGLEFRTRSPNQHAALRQQVGKDLVRAESLNPKPDAKWLAFLKNGYKQSGASEATLKAMDDRILRDFPSSPAAYRVVSSQWEEHHKEPEDSKDTAAWLAYNRIYEEALKGWIRDFPDLPYLGRSSWFYTISNDFTISEKDGVAAMDRFLKASKDYEAPSSSGYIDAADFLVQHRWQPKRALSLLHEAQPLLAKELEAEAKDDNRSAEDSDSLENSQTYQKQNFVGLMLQAARLAGRPAEAEALRSSIEAPPPKSTKRQSNYWLNRARLAELEKRKADALAYYQKALQTRVAAPTPWQGRLQDDLTDEARALWTNTGGTEVAWAVWSTSGGAKPEELKEGRWEKPKKTLPAFELADLAGKTWKLQSLEGKSVLINLWATWCGPCNAELPHLQKLYETVKGRTDLQIITFNIDTDLGLVEPFMKEKGYNFPVLPAYSLVMGLLDGVGIPQNWVVDPQGTWRWTQLGFDGAPDFVEAMIQRLESVRKSE
ncbi:MAG: TlpA disulfide reductase family protein, partial [Candidatus Sulfotelmatobacter sp.]